MAKKLSMEMYRAELGRGHLLRRPEFKVLGDEALKFIAQDLVETVKPNVSMDWIAKESARAKLRVIVKRVLRKHGYPPDKQEEATKIVLERGERLSAGWAEAT